MSSSLLCCAEGNGFPANHRKADDSYQAQIGAGGAILPTHRSASIQLSRTIGGACEVISGCYLRLGVNDAGQVWRPNASAIIKSSFGGAKGEQQRCGSLTPYQNKPPPREKLERGARFLEVRSAHPINGSRGIWFPTSPAERLALVEESP